MAAKSKRYTYARLRRIYMSAYLGLRLDMSRGIPPYARVLALKPEVILLDRPCSGLDPISTAKIEDSLTRLREKFTIVIAPHNVQQASRISDRAAFMLMGRLVEEGETEELFANPKEQKTSDYITGRFG